jgi:NodT family efflux transporter outer membrane factor (OMF) lipoprotein
MMKMPMLALGGLARTIRPSRVACIVALLGACSVGPDYRKPTADVPQDFKETAGWKLAQPDDERPRGPWWEIYGDPVLTGLVSQIQVSNQNVHAAEAQYRQALALIGSARAGYFPTVTAGVAASRSQNTTAGATGRTGAAVTSTQESLSTAWELDMWGRIRRTVESNEASAQASGADLGAALLSAQSALAQSYLQLRIVDAQRDLLERSIVAYQRAYEITANRYRAGIAQRTDVTQADAQLKTAQAQAIDLGAQRAQLEHAIAVLLGKPPAQFTIERTNLLPPLPAVPKVLPSALLERRPDVAGAERRVAAANAQIGVTQAAWYPSLSLGAAGGFQGSNFGDLSALPYRFWSVGPSLSLPLFDAGARRAQKEQAEAAYDRAVAVYRQTVLGAFQDVEDNLAALDFLERESIVQNQAQAAAAETLRLIENQYRAGTVSFLNVVIAQNTSLNADQSSLSIAGRRFAASVGLLKALGGDWRLQQVARH